MPSLSPVSKHPPTPDFLPDPFEWVYIPAGEVVLNLPQAVTYDLDAFYMAKYPITNAQYAVYVKETGRVPYITIANKNTKTSWDDENFNQSLHPVIDLYWHEAMLFCKWLSDKLEYRVTLPTDAQWQRAAQGDDGRKYPWGNEWDSTYCNNAENGINHTLPVNHYPQGASPYGVMDMAANACEWCLTDEKTRENSLEIIFPDFENDSPNNNEQRIFKGAHYQTSIHSTDIRTYGSSLLWLPYTTGIRLVTKI